MAAGLLIELWQLIFDELELVDLSACAQVSKKFNLMVKDHRIRELAFTLRTECKWFHYARSPPYRYRVDYSKAFILRSSPFNFHHLKRLKIGRSSSIVDLNHINRFAQLEELDIDLKNYRNAKSLTLSPPSLKLLYVFVPDRISLLKLDTPRLAKVCTFRLERLELSHPESVRCIHTFSHSGRLFAFRNLECLIFTDHYIQRKCDYPQDLSFEEFSPEYWRNLKEIGFYYCFRVFEMNNLSIFQRIIQTVLKLKRPDLKVFWQNLQVTDPNLLTDYKSSKENNGGSNLVFLLEHYENLRERDEFLRYMFFNHVMSKLPAAGFDPRRADFTSKFLAKICLFKIKVLDKVQYPERLMEFVASSPSLSILNIRNSGLHSSFFDRLPEILERNHIPLERLETDQQLSATTISKLLRLPLLTEIQCFTGKSGDYKIESVNRQILSE